MNDLLDLLRQQPTPRPASPDGSPTPDRFWAEGRLPAGHLSIEVEGLGPLPQPLPPTQAQALHDLSEPAQFGLREQTLLDTAVRHTGEVSADLLSLDWQPGVFAALQREVAQALGVERLDAWVHNLLIYGPGQFFKSHQDTEKHPGMVATLVVVWPSPHLGGELRVRLGAQEGGLTSQHLQTTDLRWFAFYADCRHEVRPVEEGWRVVLTFDLVMPATAVASNLPAARQQDIQAALHQQFGLDGDALRMDPWVLLLDHEYTEHGLRWPLLKGDDRWRVAALREAAESLGLEVHLALAERHETWSAEPVVRSRIDRSGRTRSETTDDVTPGELLVEEMSLDFWVDAQDRVGPRSSLMVRTEDTTCFVETGSAHLVDEEYEGYMGNYGETLDYWYRRAALVIRSSVAAERDRFLLDFDAALADARELARQAAQQPLQAVTLAGRVRAAASRLSTAAASAQGRVLLDAYADIAAALPEDEAATALMAPFDPRSLLPEDAEVIARLERQRGTPWTVALLQVWHDPQSRHACLSMSWQASGGTALRRTVLWPTALPTFTHAALDAGWSETLLDHSVQAWFAALLRFDQARIKAPPANRMTLVEGMLDAVGELAQAFALCGQAGESHRKALIDHVLALPVLYPLTRLVALVQTVGALGQGWPAAHPLRERVAEALRTALAAPERAPSDYGLRSIEWTCRCTDCAGMITWAESMRAEPLVMSMAESRRQHVQQQFSAAGAPLTAVTLRQGSPHKLVLRKPDDLHARERVLREDWAHHLSALAALDG